MASKSGNDPEDTGSIPEPARARAVFSTDDFKLLRTAVLAYMKAHEDDEDSVRYSNLYHRLGRLG